MNNLDIIKINPMKKIIEKLASKELSFGCRVSYRIWDDSIIVGGSFEIDKYHIAYIHSMDENFSSVSALRQDFEILGHPVYKHHVEEEILKHVEKICVCSSEWLKEEQCDCGSSSHSEILWRLTTLWKPLGLSKSLQQIAEKSGYEEVCMDCVDGYDCECEDESTNLQTRLKDPKARELEQFIERNLGYEGIRGGELSEEEEI